MSAHKVIILGSGCAGLTAAIYAARAGLEPLLIEGSQPGGQLTTTSEVENFPGFPEGIDGSALMQNLRKQASRFGTQFQNDLIESVQLGSAAKKLKGSQNYTTQTLIIATGASPRLLGVPGEQELFGGKGVTTCATCDGFFYKDQEVAVLGGGDSACEEALFLTRFCKKVTLVHRRDTLRASKIMAERTLEHPKITPLWNQAVQAMLADESSGKLCGLQLKDTQTQQEQVLGVSGCFVAIGHIPNTQFLGGQLDMDEQGYLLSSASSGVHTHIEGVYTAGDCADHVYRQAITAAGMGCRAAIEAERWLAERND